MIQIANFQPRFFIDLYKMLVIYGDLYIVEDGNIYRKESQAQRKCIEKMKIANLNEDSVTNLRYIRVSISKFPKNAEEISKMFDDQEIERRRSTQEEMNTVKAPKFTDISDAEAMKALGIAEGTDPEGTDNASVVYIREVAYPVADIRKAMKLHNKLGTAKVQAAIDELNEADTDSLLSTL